MDNDGLIEPCNLRAAPHPDPVRQAALQHARDLAQAHGVGWLKGVLAGAGIKGGLLSDLSTEQLARL